MVLLCVKRGQTQKIAKWVDKGFLAGFEPMNSRHTGSDIMLNKPSQSQISYDYLTSTINYILDTSNSLEFI